MADLALVSSTLLEDLPNVWLLLDFALGSVSVVGDAVPPLLILLLNLPDLLDGNELSWSVELPMIEQSS